MTNEEQVKDLSKDAHCVSTKGYGGNPDFTIWADGKRISVTRFSEDKAWQDAFERLTDLRPKLEEWMA